MQSESFNRGQQFASMASLAGFSGNADFWEDLTPLSRAEYAGICRVNPRVKMFFLDLWLGSATIQAAVKEYRDEKNAEELASAEPNLEY